MSLVPLGVASILPETGSDKAETETRNGPPYTDSIFVCLTAAALVIINRCQRNVLKMMKWWHSLCHWSLLHYRQDMWVKTEMVRTCPATRRWPLRQACPWRWGAWTSELGKAEEEMDKHHLTRPHQPEPHTCGRRRSRRLEKKNACDWPLTWGIHSLNERERETREMY